MNIRVDLNYLIKDGTEVIFRSPVDCSQVTGLKVYYKDNWDTFSKEFAFADAHGNNVGDIDHLFAEDVVVKVILDVTKGMAFVQNADTNAYLESHIQSKENPHGVTPAQIGALSKAGDTMSGDLNINKGIPAVRFDSGTGTAAFYKNAAGANDYGTIIEDVRTDGSKAAIELHANDDPKKAFRFHSSKTNETYNVLHTGNMSLISPTEIGALGVKLDGINGSTGFNSGHNFDEIRANIIGWVNPWTGNNTGVHVPPVIGFFHSFYHYDQEVQKVYATDGSLLYRAKNSATADFGEWEWENPPMWHGVEYRTTERWQGKAVYTQLVNCGAFPAVGAETDYKLGSDITNVIRVAGSFKDIARTVPYFDTTEDVRISATSYLGNTYIRVHVVKGTMTSHTCIAQAWYTKD